jgi:hypothetical protein
MSILTHTQTSTATFDNEIAALGANLETLQDFARSLPTGATVPLDRRAEFMELEARVSQQFDRLSYALEAIERDTVY